VVFQSRPVSPSPVYPAGRVGTPADPNIPPGRESSWGQRGSCELSHTVMCLVRIRRVRGLARGDRDQTLNHSMDTACTLAACV
jgi:hypothetical protein